jgi:hypothetical protein
MNHVKETLGFLVFEAPNTAAVLLKAKPCCECATYAMDCEAL